MGDNFFNEVLFSKNLNVVTFANGDPIPKASSIEEWIDAGRNKSPVYCTFGFAGDAAPGLFYNWYAVNDARGLAPEGWHIPCIEEIHDFVRNSPSADFNGLLTDFEERGLDRQWLHGVLSCGFQFVGEQTYYWCSDEINIDEANFFMIGSFLSGEMEFDYATHKSDGCFVACIKNLP